MTLENSSTFKKKKSWLLSRIKNLNFQSRLKPYLEDRTDCELESPFGESYYFLVKSKFEGNKKNRDFMDQNIHVFLVIMILFLLGDFYLLSE